MKFVSASMLLILALLAQSALSDDMRPNSLILQENSDRSLDVSWKRPIKKGSKNNLQVEFDGDVRAEPRRRYLIDNYSVEYWTLRRLQGVEGLNLSVSGFDKKASEVILRFTDRSGHSETKILKPRHNRYQLAGAEPSTSLDTLLQYIYLGVEHILIGLDHLLFIGCLVYISRTPRKLFWTITGFTLAHSITLTLAATGVVLLPIAPVEAVIALSIVFLAAEIAKNRSHSISLKYPVLVSSSFGLLHGFGFASVLADIGLPAQAEILALVGFNLGVELGQLFFVAALFALFMLAKAIFKHLRAENIRLPVSYLCGSVGTLWVIERITAF